MFALDEINANSGIFDYIDTAKVCTDILLQLINNILDSSKSEAGTLEIDP